MRIAAWEDWNGHALDYMAGRRKKRDRPSSIEWMRLASTWSQEVTLFAVTLKDPRADAFVVRLLQYVATHAADTGEIAIPRSLFGPVVLSTIWDPVSQETGERVWDALLLHGICTATDLHPRETGRDGTEQTEQGEAPPAPTRLAPSNGKATTAPAPGVPDRAAEADAFPPQYPPELSHGLAAELAGHGVNWKKKPAARQLKVMAQALCDEGVPARDLALWLNDPKNAARSDFEMRDALRPRNRLGPPVIPTSPPITDEERARIRNEVASFIGGPRRIA